MDPLILLIEPDLDERAATATMTRAQRVYEEGARDISRVMREQLTEGTEAAGRGFDDLETKARKAYLGMQDAADKVAREERKLEAARERGASNTEALARRVERARLDEISAIERATSAYREYESAANGAGQAGGESFLSGLSGAMSGAGQSGTDMANEFAGGFASSSALMRLGAAGGPIGIALAGVAALGYASGKVLADNLAAGMASLEMRDLFAARLGADESTMERIGAASSQAFINGWGSSPEENMRVVQAGFQAGLVGSDASDTELLGMTQQLQTVASVMEEDATRIAAGARNLIHTGLVGSYQEAFDLLVTGSQQGLDITGDLLDSMEEYATAWNGVGLTGTDALGLINQMMDAGIRNTDVAADSIKELAISLTDGSATDALSAMGFDATDMANRFAQGGAVARTALGEVLDALGSIEDPMQRNLNGQDLFKTKWEDAKTAIEAANLSTAATDLGQIAGATEEASTKIGEHANQWDALGRNIDATFGKLQRWLADSTAGEFLLQGLPGFLNDNLFAGSAEDQARAKLEAAQAAERERREAAATAPAIPGRGLHWEDGRGWVSDDAPPARGDLQFRDPAGASGGAARESLPPAPSLPLEYSNTAGLPTAIANASVRLDEARHDVAEKEARVNQLEQSNIASAEDRQKARNDLVKAEQDQLQAEQSLNDARAKAFETANQQMDQMTSDIGEFGASIDADFGASKGLAGIAENITKFLANLAFAPAFGALSAVREANGFGPGEAGSGLAGALGSTGMFGDQGVAVPRWARDQQAAAGTPAAAGYASTPMALSGIPQSRFSDANLQPNAARLNDVIAAYFPGITEIGGYRANGGGAPDHPSGRALDIMIPGWDTPEGKAYGDQINTFLHTNADALGIDSTIWQDYWQPVGGEGNYLGRQGANEGHYNHIHALTSAGDPAAGGNAVTGAPGAPGIPDLSGVPGLAGGPLAAGMPNAAMFSRGAAPSQSVTGGRAHAQGLPESGGIGVGGSGLFGLLGSAVSGAAGAAGSAAGMGMDGGAGGQIAAAVADMGIQQLQRAAGAMGQYAGAAAGGLIETFGLNGSALGDPSASWLGRMAAVVPGVRPALPNTAGELGGAQNPNMAEAGKEPPGAMEGQPPGPMSPEDAAKMQSAVGKGGDDNSNNSTNVHIHNPQSRSVDGSMRDAQTAIGNQNFAKVTATR